MTKSSLRLALALVGIASLFLASCNTISGAGRDVKRLGEGVSNTAEGREF